MHRNFMKKFHEVAKNDICSSFRVFLSLFLSPPLPRNRARILSNRRGPIDEKSRTNEMPPIDGTGGPRTREFVARSSAARIYGRKTSARIYAYVCIYADDRTYPRALYCLPLACLLFCSSVLAPIANVERGNDLGGRSPAGARREPARERFAAVIR